MSEDFASRDMERVIVKWWIRDDQQRQNRHENCREGENGGKYGGRTPFCRTDTPDDALERRCRSGVLTHHYT
jgi:hypothetical protein